MNKHKLGCYLAYEHDPAKWQQYLFDIDPPVIRLLMKGTDYTIVSKVYSICPEAEISLRWWDTDDGGEGTKRAKLLDPENAATHDAVIYADRIREMEVQAKGHGLPFPSRGQLLVNTLNEPPIWEPGVRQQVVRYCRQFIREAADFGLGVIGGEINVGHPAEWPPEWEWFREVANMLVDFDGYLGLHEYWKPAGPLNGEDWGALAGRYLKCPFDVPIIISETGVDGGLINEHKNGYQKYMSPVQFAGQMGSYLAQVKKDKRIKAVLPFLTDFQDHEWYSFDTLPAKDELDRVLAAMDKDSEQVDTRLPSISVPGPAPVPVVSVPANILDPHVLAAILAVESNGRGFVGERLVIRFEAHIFLRYVGSRGDPNFYFNRDNILQAYYRKKPTDPWADIHGSQDTEYDAFAIALDIDEGAAYRSISMGASQVMGFNHARVGFPTPESMYEAFVADSNYHIISLLNYCLGDSNLVKAIQGKDFRTIARLYNGPGLVDLYSGRLEKAYKELTG